jgi:4-amino-4-deoxy-L-arabinose transferase-like glycosyltransferase
MILKKNIDKTLYLFLFTHLLLWTLIPSLSNTNLPLDTIEALAWGSNLDWGFNKHPPLSAFAVQFFYKIFGNSDWSYYFLSQIFVITAFYFVWKLSNLVLEDKTYSLLSVLILSGIYYYNFTTPEFNVNVSQLPFWALTVYFFWKSLNENKKIHWILFGIFSALGFLSKYLFIYILFALLIFFILNLKKYNRSIKNYIFSVIISLTLLIPHFVWLFDNNFITIFYGLARSGVSDFSLVNHIKNPVIFLLKQSIILIPFFIMALVTIKKFQFKIKKKDKNFFFLLCVNLIPIILMLITSILTGAKIRTMWMTPFYLFLGTLFFLTFKKDIVLNKIKKFYYVFLFFFIFSPILYLGVSVIDKTKRTDYPGKEIARLVQNKWDDNFINEIKIVVGDEWSAGNLSYHLYSRPIWTNDLKNSTSNITEDQGVIYTGNAEILKKICPGVFGEIKPVGYCMIGKR